MKGKIAMIVSLAIVGVFALALLIYYFGAFYPTFNQRDNRKEFDLPGLEDSFVPQGIDYVDGKDVVLVSGYMSDGRASRIYMIDRLGGQVIKYVTCTVGGEVYAGHAGGIATDGNRVWIAGDKQLLTFSYELLEALGNEETLPAESVFETGNGCDFVDVVNDKLLVGEFYREGKYETPQQHHVAVSKNEKTHAMAYLYEINDSLSGIAKIPTMALTLPDHAQGIAVVDAAENQKIVISTSWSIPSSKLLVYDSPFDGEPTRNVIISQKEVPVYELNSLNLVQSIKAPAMSEELTVVDDLR